jgi:hypothetical protein
MFIYNNVIRRINNYNSLDDIVVFIYQLQNDSDELAREPIT